LTQINHNDPACAKALAGRQTPMPNQALNPNAQISLGIKSLGFDWSLVIGYWSLGLD